jgi:hypothetical protein
MSDNFNMLSKIYFTILCDDTPSVHHLISLSQTTHNLPFNVANMAIELVDKTKSKEL